MIEERILLDFGASKEIYHKGDQLFGEGEIALNFFQIISGEIKMNNYNADGKEFIQGLFVDGQSFGEPPLLADVKYPANAEAIKTSEVLKLPKLNFLELLTQHPETHLKLTALAFNIALSHENKIKGFGLAILLWLFLAVVYDGIFLLSLVYFQDYPLDKFSLVASMLNPIDLSRILILLKLDISALLGYTGAVFKQFFGTGLGAFTSIAVLSLWVILPIWRIKYISAKKDF